MSPQAIVLVKYNLFRRLMLEVNRIIYSHRGKGYLNSYQLWSLLSNSTKARLNAMMYSFKVIKIAEGKEVKGGFYEISSFVGTIASILQKSSSIIKVRLEYDLTHKKLLPHFGI